MNKDITNSTLTSDCQQKFHCLNTKILEQAYSITKAITQSVDIDGTSNALRLLSAAFSATINHNKPNDVLIEDNNRSTNKPLTIYSALLAHFEKSFSATIEIHRKDILTTSTNTMNSLLKAVGYTLNQNSGFGTRIKDYLINATNNLIHVVPKFSAFALNFIFRMIKWLFNYSKNFLHFILQHIFSKKRTRTTFFYKIILHKLFTKAPPINICFTNFSALIRKIYLPHTRERGTSDDDDDNSLFCYSC